MPAFYNFSSQLVSQTSVAQIFSVQSTSPDTMLIQEALYRVAQNARNGFSQTNNAATGFMLPKENMLQAFASAGTECKLNKLANHNTVYIYTFNGRFFGFTFALH